MGLDGLDRSLSANGGLHSCHGQMIAPLCDAGQGTRASFVASDFQLDVVPEQALLRVTALGLYRVFLNGVRVGSALLTPGWTCYDDRLAVQDWPVADLLRQGENRIEIWLGDGWYRGPLMSRAFGITETWGRDVAALAEILADGKPLVATGPDWRAGLLPVLQNGIYYGEDYDARISPVETSGVRVVTGCFGLLVPQETELVRELPPILPVDSWQDEGRTVFDFGQNAAGFLRFAVEGEAGAELRFEHSEVLGPGRAWDNRNFRSARAEQRYVLRGGAVETHAPLFTFMGFRYARLNVSGEARLVALEFVPISSVPDVAGGFTCGVPAVNRLVWNTIWSQRSNFIEVPTDCPQRDERLGWTGDAQVFAGTACWLADCESFLKKFMRDVRYDQREHGGISFFSPDPTRLKPIPGRGDYSGSTGWGDVITILPWQLYLHYGDKGVLAENFPAMLRWLDYLWSISEGPILRPPLARAGRGFTFGDWLQPVGDNRKPRPTIADDCAATLYHFISTDLAARIAEVLGETDHAARLTARAAEISRAFQLEFFSASGRIAHNDQTSWSLAFLHGLVPPEHHDAAKAYFRRVIEEAEGLIGTGFIGTPALLPALSSLGMTDLAEKVFLNRKVPGWLYQVEQGATTIWERWDSMAPDGTIHDPEMNSYNHYAYGAVCQWLFEAVAGVAPSAEGPGFATVILDPVILPALSPVAMWHGTAKGRIDSAWVLDGTDVTWRLTLPQGCAGILAMRAAPQGFAVDGQPAKPGDRLAPGSYEITFRI